MNEMTWKALQSLVKADDIKDQTRTDKVLSDFSKKMFEIKVQELWADHKKNTLFTFQWLQDVCNELEIDATSNTRLNLLRKALPLIYAEGKQNQLYERFAELEKQYERLLEIRNEAKQLYTKMFKGTAKEEVFGLTWLKKECKRLGINVKLNRDQIFIDALTEIILRGKSRDFTQSAKDQQKEGRQAHNKPDANRRTTKREKLDPRRKDEIRKLYRSLLGKDADFIENELQDFFPDGEGFEKHLMQFLRFYGMSVKKSKNRDAWLRAVAEYISKYHTGAKGIG